jgi:hypothetical protein
MTRIRNNERFDAVVGSRQLTHSSHIWGDHMAEEKRRIAPLGARLKVLLTLVLAVCGLAVPAASAVAANFNWSGSGPFGSKWSNGTNWEGTPPSGAVGTLNFPALTSPACTAKPTTATCYSSLNDVAGLSANALTIDDGVQYFITGTEISLGAGGIVASPSVNDKEFNGAFIKAPIALTAPQTWSITGGSHNQQLGIAGNVTGGTETLGVKFTNSTFLGINGDMEVGAVTATGVGVIALGGGGTGSLNGTNLHAVTLKEGAGLAGFGGTIGPLTMNGGQLQVGDPAPSPGTFTVKGTLTLESAQLSSFISKPGMTAGTDYSQLIVSESINLTNTQLLVGTGGGACPALALGEKATLVTSTGQITGRFVGVGEGAIIKVFCSSGTQPSVRINYTEHSVTATVVNGGGQPTITELSASSTTPNTNENVTLTATVKPQSGSGVPSGSVEFLDGGTAIGSCASQMLIQGAFSSTATCTLSYPAAGTHSITATYLGDSAFSGSTSSPAQTVTVHGAPGENKESKESNNSNSNNVATTATTSGGVLTFKASGPPPPVAGQSETASVLSGTATVHAKGSSGFVPLTGASSIPDGSEVDATNGRVLITTATLTPGKTQSAEVYGGRFKVHQDAKGVAHLILTLPLTGCPTVTLPHGSAAAVASGTKHGHSGPKSRHLWVSETGGKWGTNGRYVSTTVEGTNWLTLDECNQSQVKVVSGKVQIHDLVHNKTKTLTAGQHLSAIRSARKH